jgi:glycerol-1-phosphate dehydrogenase [NAD(P)+]
VSPTTLPEKIDIGPGAAGRMAAYCAGKLGAGGGTGGGAPGQSLLRIVADRRTWAAMGEEAERELRRAGIATRATIFGERCLAADAESVFRLLLDDDPRERLYLAVGSGTITDIVRFAAHRTGRDFVSLATAPSVDAYASIVAPMIVDGTKKTVAAAAPLAVFADSEALALAPRPMIAAGFGDMICKFSAVADWRLGALLWDEGFDEAIARRSVAAAASCVEAAAAIGAAEPAGLEALMAALVESGICMAEAGHSRPASGAEHQYSHYWELRRLAEGKPSILHGLKVGLGTLETARLWELVRGTRREGAAALLAASALPPRAAEEGRIRAAYGKAADGTIAAHERFLAMGEAEYGALKRGILGSWDAILGIAATVPGTKETKRLLALAGCPTDPRALGLGRREAALGLSSAHYIRDRFTVKKLARVLGLG